MRLREFLVGTALMSLALVTARAFPESQPSSELWRDSGDDPKGTSGSGKKLAVPVTPPPLIQKDKVLGSAYYDTLSILNVTSSCSDFFGGPSAAMEVFTGLMGRITRQYLSISIGIRMSGPLTSVFNSETKTTYRLFDEVSINVNGPFYRRKSNNPDRAIHGIGSFLPDSREVRVLMFLHELGHLIKGPDGKWLLPDDGNNEDLSKANSQKIEGICGEQIRGLSRIDALNLAKLKKPKERLASSGRHSLKPAALGSGATNIDPFYFRRRRMKSTAVWESGEIGLANSPQPNDDPGVHASSPSGVQDSVPITSQDKIQRLQQMALRLFREMQSLNEVHTLNIDGGLDFYDEVTRFEIDLITRALLHTGGHQGHAARLLNLKVTTLNSKIKHYDIKLEGFAPGYPFAGNNEMETRPHV